MAQKIKVLHVISSFGMGGAETWLMELLRYWSKRGNVECHFLLTSGTSDIFDEEAKSLGAQLFYCKYGRNRLCKFGREFREILHANAYDAIHDHQGYASGLHFLLGTGLLPKIRVIHIHNPSYQIAQNRGLRRLGWKAGELLSKIYATVVAGTSVAALRAWGFALDGKPKALGVPCGFNTIRFTGIHSQAKQAICHECELPPNSKIILFAGRMDESPELSHPQNHKNSRLAIEIGISAMKINPLVRFILIGQETSAVLRLKEVIADNGLADNFHFLGIRKDIERYMLAANLLLFPSREEGLGMVAVEAQAAGLPVLASTGVPRECLVCPGLVQFLSLELSVEYWASQAALMMDLPKNQIIANEAVRNSPYGIENSALALAKLYTGEQ